MSDPWTAQTEALGAFIRSQRELAQLSLRQVAEITKVSHPYLSQVERGLHQPSVRVLKLLSEALNVSAETLLMQAGLLEGDNRAGDETGVTERVKSAIRADHRLSEAQQAALIAVYDSMLRDLPPARPYMYRPPLTG
jgi:transcriptional regulator with XRE-family HTH domain